MNPVIEKLYTHAYAQHSSNILHRLEFDPHANFLDVGCENGSWTKILGERIGTSKMSGMETVALQAIQARNKGIKVMEAEIDRDWHFVDAQFDVVHAGFMIERVLNIDHFISEIYRVLKPGGYTLVSTENGSSWHNLLATLLGWQSFSASNLSAKTRALGNPLALHLGEGGGPSGQTRKVVFNYRGFKELFWYHGFSQIEVWGAGYYPLPAYLGRWDPRHAHLLSLKAMKR